MATIDDLDADISHLNTRIATLHAHRANLASILLSQPHLSTRLQTPTKKNSLPTPTERAINQQATRNVTNIYRACAGVTAYKVLDPDPSAINNGHVLGVSIDVALGGKFVETYHVLLNWRKRDDGGKVLRIHKHTIPPCIPLQQLANMWLPAGEKEVEQDLVRFGRALRKELMGWHLRVRAVEECRKEAGLATSRSQDAEEAEDMNTGQVMNAFVSDDEASSDAEVEDDTSPRFLSIEGDTAVRQVTITWSDRRTAVLSITKDGRVDKAVCRMKDGTRDMALSRRAIGPIGGLVRRLNA